MPKVPMIMYHELDASLRSGPERCFDQWVSVETYWKSHGDLPGCLGEMIEGRGLRSLQPRQHVVESTRRLMDLGAYEWGRAAALG
jgi:hypothetical protein